MHQISIIVAHGLNKEIGYKNQLIWHLPNDLKRFKAITTGHTIVMGRKTFESLPKGALPNRRNIILSHQNYSAPNAEVFHSVEELLKQLPQNEVIFIIGGASIYQTFFPLAQRLYLTLVDGTFQSDVLFPDYQLDLWSKASEIHYQKDEKHAFNYTFLDLVKSI